jgi:hypothetical protein
MPRSPSYERLWPKCPRSETTSDPFDETSTGSATGTDDRTLRAKAPHAADGETLQAEALDAAEGTTVQALDTARSPANHDTATGEIPTNRATAPILWNPAAVATSPANHGAATATIPPGITA